MDLADFLPKYPNIHKLSNDNLNPYEGNFSQNIYKKKELYDYKLDVVEEVPRVPGQLMNHQTIIRRFLSSHTLYDKLLLVHEMGTGKSSSAIGAIETIRDEGTYRGVLVLARGEALLKNFIEEIVFVATDGRYIPENSDKLTRLEKIHRRKKALGAFYNFETFKVFAKKIKASTDAYLREKYDNYIIVIDEVHNIRIHENKADADTYANFLRFLRVVKGCKVLLLSGTPMKDGVEEISSVMNLLLPSEKALPTGEKFLEEYFDEDTSTIKPSKVKEIKSIMTGRVSYLKAMESAVTKVFMGEKMGSLEHFKVVPSRMSEFQSRVYMKAYKLDKDGDKKGIYTNSRQATLFVYPNETYAGDGFNNPQYIKSTTSKMGGLKRVGGGLKSYSMGVELRRALEGGTDEEKINKIRKYSSIYADSITLLLKAKRERKSMFIYNEYIEGSGLILFTLLLELFGFSKASGFENENLKGDKYISLTSVTATDEKIKTLVNRFNQPDNMHGDIIRVIVGSRKISEGFTFKNIQVEDIQTPWYNYSETAQVIARGYRLGSHNALLSAGVIPTVSIYQRVNIPQTGQDNSIDLFMYETSEKKDISIKSVERLIKEASFDCALTYKRNRNYDDENDGTRDCDYMECKYTCDGIKSDEYTGEPLILDDNELDYSTYQLWYSSEVHKQIIDTIVDMYKTIFSMDLLSIYATFPSNTEFEVLTALNIMINKSIPITNKYGYISYLRENSNIYFLIDTLSIKARVTSEYYTEYPVIKEIDIFNDIIRPIYYETLPNTIEELCKITTQEQLRNYLLRLPKDVIQILLEACITSKETQGTNAPPMRDLILDFYKQSYHKLEQDNIWVILLNKDNLRCYKAGEEFQSWSDCPQDIIDKMKNELKKEQENLENNPYGYYGKYNPEIDKFCIKEVTKDDIGEDARKKTPGKVCTIWTPISTLFDLVVHKLKLPVPSDDEVKAYFKTLSKQKKIITDLTNRTILWETIKKYPTIAKMYTNVDPTINPPRENSKDTKTNDMKHLTTSEMIRILYWSTRQKKDLCVYIKDWFEQHNLLIQDDECGKRGKHKK